MTEAEQDNFIAFHEHRSDAAITGLGTETFAEWNLRNSPVTKLAAEQIENLIHLLGR